MARNTPLLTIKVKMPPDVAPGHIPVPLLLRICGEAQKAVNRQAEALEGRKSEKPGPVREPVARECTLELIGLKKGSTTLDFDQTQKQQLLPEMRSLSVEAVSGVANTLNGIVRRRGKGPAPDLGVLEALDELGQVLDQGVDKLQLIVPAVKGERKRVVANFGAQMLSKIRSRKQELLPLNDGLLDRPSVVFGVRFGPVQRSTEEPFLEGMLEPLDGKVRISPVVGPSTVLAFGADKAENVYEAMHKPVKVSVDPKTHKLKDIQITQTTLFPDAGFFAQKTIDQLIAEQRVQPVNDLSVFGSLSDDDVDDLIAEIHLGRQD